MQMTMLELFLGGGADAQNGDIKIKVFTSHGVVQVQLNGILTHRGGHTLENVPGGIAQAHGFTHADFKVRWESGT